VDWNCTLTEERLSDYLEGYLAIDERAAFEAHRETCARCAELVARVGSLVTEMHGLEPLEAPANLQARILDATLGPRPKKAGWRRWFSWTPMIWQPRFAIGIATVAACAVIVVQAGGVMPTKMHKANLNPADVFRSVNRQAHLTYARSVKFVNDLRVVYEIETRLDTQNPPQQATPPPRHDSQPNSNYPQQKSETHRNRRGTPDGVIYAGVAPGNPNLDQGSSATADNAGADASPAANQPASVPASTLPSTDDAEPEWSAR